MKHFIVILLSFLILEAAHSKFSINIGITHKKGGDEGTPLVSEIYSRENVYYEELIILKMHEEIILKVQAFFSMEKETYGPSKRITIKGTITSSILQEEKQVLLEVDLGDKVQNIYEFSDKRIVELNFHPVI